MRFILELVPSGGKLGNKKIGPITNIVILIMIIMITDRYNCSGDYRYACTLVGHYFVQKNSQNAGANLAKKAYQCIFYTPMRLRIASNPQVYL